jgi:hypothetical protein
VFQANDYRIYISRSQDPKKNPLVPNDKLKVMKDMFPRIQDKIEIIPSNMVLELAAKLYNKGYTKVIMVSGSR